jgi:diaminopimelate epimerase
MFGMIPLPFRKMHGIGNDFVVLDGRAGDVTLEAAEARAIADRHSGIGCDQIILLQPPWRAGANVLARFFNADGSESSACGNGARCVASLIMQELGRNDVTIETRAGSLDAWATLDGLVSIDMGPARLGWQDVPLVSEMDTLNVPTGIAVLDEAVCCSMGNPHATFFVDDADAIDLDRLGPVLETHALFPERANIGVASLLGPSRLRLRVWERGVGMTLACGSGACAALVGAARRGITGCTAEIVMERGSLTVDWQDSGRVLLTGPAATSFIGTTDASLIAG